MMYQLVVRNKLNYFFDQFLSAIIILKILIVAILIFGFDFTCRAQSTSLHDSVIIAANADCNQNFVQRILFGKHYRSLWKTPVAIGKLNLEQSGYKIIKEGGSRETFNLRITDSLGRQFVARSIKKDLTKALPIHLQKSIVRKLFRDLMFANHPYGPLIVPPLAEAAGVLHSNPLLFLIDADSTVGSEYKNDSTSLMILLEERPDDTWSREPIFNYASKIVSSESYLDNIFNRNNTSTDAELFLRTRMLDLFIGDWSRHEDQYRWTLKDSNDVKFYQPVPRDRDHAFYKFNDGLINKISLLLIPKTVTFGKKIKNVDDLNLVGAMLGKIILTKVSRQRWNAIIEDVKISLTDDVITKAVSRLPEEIYALHGEKLISHLKSRRNHLSGTGKTFYKLIFTKPNVIGSNEDEIFKINRSENETHVQVFGKRNDGHQVILLFDRIFYTEETRQIKIFGLEGNDTIEISGTNKGIKLEIHPGPGIDNVVIDENLSKRIEVEDEHDYNFTQYFLKKELQ